MPGIRQNPEYVQRVQDSYRPLSTYQFNTTLLNEGIQSNSPRDRITRPVLSRIASNRILLEKALMVWMGKHHRVSHTGDWPKFPLDSLLTPPFSRPMLRPDPTARNIDDHWYEWFLSESQWWGQKNFAIVGLDEDKMKELGLETSEWHRGHFYQGKDYYELFTGVNRSQELVKIGLQPIPIGILARSVQGQELPMRVFDYTTRDDPFYARVPWE